MTYVTSGCLTEEYTLFCAIAIWNAIKIITFKVHTAHMQMVNKL